MTSADITKGHRFISRILENRDIAPVNPGHFVLSLDAPEISKAARPGQFIHILPPGNSDLLRRPISIIDANPANGSVKILLRVIGDGTRLIAESRVGEELDIIGPLGNGYTIYKDRPVVIVGGGVGIPPLLFLARKMLDARIKPEVLLGARDMQTLICVEEFESLGLSPEITTEDGSVGTKGFVTEIMGRGSIKSNPVVYSCGPIAMLKAVYQKACDLDWTDCYVSLENKLGCGVGACLGCSIPVYDINGGIYYERVCMEGPVFEASMVAFEKIR